MADLKKPAAPATFRVGEEVELVVDVRAKPGEHPFEIVPAGIRGTVSAASHPGSYEVRFASRGLYVVVGASDLRKVK